VERKQERMYNRAQHCQRAIRNVVQYLDILQEDKENTDTLQYDDIHFPKEATMILQLNAFIHSLFSTSKNIMT
jgi:hypothetical protein